MQPAFNPPPGLIVPRFLDHPFPSLERIWRRVFLILLMTEGLALERPKDKGKQTPPPILSM